MSELTSQSHVVLIGVFDGVHKGHQELLNRAKAIADGRQIIALTFDPHPTTVFAPDRAPTMLTTLADRVELLKIHGADQVAVVKFNEKFAAMSPDDFVKTVLVDQLHASTIIVGKNFTYGHKAAGTVETLIESAAQYNFTVDAQELQLAFDHWLSTEALKMPACSWDDLIA
jgi:riboflavin kinase / FMN adenylyltransferase